MTIKVSKRVLDGIKFVRDTGRTNMLDFYMVQRIAYENEYYDTVIWMEKNKNLYTRGIFEGFEIEDIL